MEHYPIWMIVVFGLIFINLISFAAFGFDKRRARANRRRVPERNLLWLVAIGGGVGAIAGQRFFRHKTGKQPFKRQMWTIIAAQTALPIVYLALR